jgi:hypothetical protein
MKARFFEAIIGFIMFSKYYVLKSEHITCLVGQEFSSLVTFPSCSHFRNGARLDVDS